MDTYLNKSLPGPGYADIVAALALPPDSPVAAVLAEIRRLHTAAAEGPQPIKKRGKKDDKKDISEENPYSL